MITFTDESSSPLPPGIYVTITDANSNVVGFDYLRVGGTTVLNPVPLRQYTATFFGTQAPSAPTTFTAMPGVTEVQVLNYRSPLLSLDDYSTLQTSLWPLNRFSNAASSPGGVAYAVASAGSAILSTLDVEVQQTLGAERLVSSSGSAVDSWANDILGIGTWPRGPLEGNADNAYINRIIAWLTTPFTTIYGIQKLANLWLQTYVVVGTDNVLALDESGGLDLGGALDTTTPQSTPLSTGSAASVYGTAVYGSSDYTSAGVILPSVGIIPSIYVFDWMSNPTLSASVGLPQFQGYFAVLFSYLNTPPAVTPWYLGLSYLGVNDWLGAAPEYYTVGPISSDLDRIIQTVKAVGTTPIYYANIPTVVPV